MVTYLIALIIIFADPIFFCVLKLAGLKAESGLLQYEFIGIFIVSVIYFIIICSKKKISYNSLMLIFLTILTGIIYFTTSFIYEYENTLYISEFLRWGSICIPSVLIGILCNREKDKVCINSLLPYFIITLSSIISYVGITESLKNVNLIHDDSGLIYQNISYYMAFLWGCSSYWLFFSKSHKPLYIKYLIYFFIILQTITCIVSGGRGGGVLLATNFFITLLYYSHQRNYSLIRTVVVGVIIITSLILIIRIFDLNNLLGYQRIYNISEVDNRSYLYIQAWNFFKESMIIGSGLGSVFYKLNAYSHNFILDLLLETGIIGVLLFFLILIKSSVNLLYSCKQNSNYIFFLFVLSYFVIDHLFSGYWFVSQHFWFIIAISFSNPFTLYERDTIID